MTFIEPNKRTSPNYLIFITLVVIGNVLSPVNSQCQKTNIQIGSEIPLNYSLGIDQKVSDHFSLNLKAGILTKPYDKIILDVIKSFGTDEAVVNTIGDAFDFGFIAQLWPHYLWKRNYFGIGYSMYALRATNPPGDLIESYYGITLPPPPFGSERDLTLNSTLHNIGICYGHDFNFRNRNSGIRLELTFSKTFASKSKIRNQDGELPRTSGMIDKELNDYYMDYGYLPSLNLFYFF